MTATATSLPTATGFISRTGIGAASTDTASRPEDGAALAPRVKPSRFSAFVGAFIGRPRAAPHERGSMSASGMYHVGRGLVADHGAGIAAAAMPAKVRGGSLKTRQARTWNANARKLAQSLDTRHQTALSKAASGDAGKRALASAHFLSGVKTDALDEATSRTIADIGLEVARQDMQADLRAHPDPAKMPCDGFGRYRDGCRAGLDLFDSLRAGGLGDAEAGRELGRMLEQSRAPGVAPDFLSRMVSTRRPVPAAQRRVREDIDTLLADLESIGNRPAAAARTSAETPPPQVDPLERAQDDLDALGRELATLEPVAPELARTSLEDIDVLLADLESVGGTSTPPGDASTAAETVARASAEAAIESPPADPLDRAQHELDALERELGALESPRSELDETLDFLSRFDARA